MGDKRAARLSEAMAERGLGRPLDDVGRLCCHESVLERVGMTELGDGRDAPVGPSRGADDSRLSRDMELELRGEEEKEEDEERV